MTLGLVIGLGVLLLVSAVLKIALSRMVARRTKAATELAQEIERSGERALGEPEWARRRVGHRTEIGSLVVTDKRLVFLSGLGGTTSIAFDDIEKVRRASTFNTSVYAGSEWVILSVRGADEEVGFITRSETLERTMKKRRAA